MAADLSRFGGIFRTKDEQASTAPSSHWQGTRRTLGFCLIVGALAFGAATWSLKGSGTSAILWALALFAVGLLFGFLFGHPRSSRGQTTQGFPSAQPVQPREGGGATGPTPLSSAATSAAGASSGLSPTTSLDEITDWLTKIIVGVTLVELKHVPDLLGDLSVTIGRSLVASDTASRAALDALATGGILYFWTIGFLFGYLWLRLRLQSAIGQSDADLSRIQIDARNVAFKDAGAALASQNPELITDAADLRVDLWSTDPNKGKFGGSAASNGRVLQAVLAPAIKGHPEVIAASVDLTVQADKSDNPLVDPVTFVLHPTFNQPEVTVNPVDGVARLKLHQAWGAFTVGVRADKGKTMLELDLATLPGAPKGFSES